MYQDLRIHVPVKKSTRTKYLPVKAVERLLKFDKESAGKYRYVMKPEMYSTLTHAKVISKPNLSILVPTASKRLPPYPRTYDMNQKEIKRDWASHKAWPARYFWPAENQGILQGSSSLRYFFNMGISMTRASANRLAT